MNSQFFWSLTGAAVCTVLVLVGARLFLHSLLTSRAAVTQDERFALKATVSQWIFRLLAKLLFYTVMLLWLLPHFFTGMQQYLSTHVLIFSVIAVTGLTSLTASDVLQTLWERAWLHRYGPEVLSEVEWLAQRAALLSEEERCSLRKRLTQLP